jgi:uncharacterized repeat protein (TIGR03803 family)
MKVSKALIGRAGSVLAVLALGFGGGLTEAQTEGANSGSVKFKTLYSFSGPDGAQPIGGLVQSINGNLYGTTEYGGANGGGSGNIFEITPGGTLAGAFSLCSPSNQCPDGIYLVTGLVPAVNGDFYGTTLEGAVFRMTLNGALTTIYQFCSQAKCVDGEYPQSLVRAANGNLYGTTLEGGTFSSGTVFKIDPSGTFTTLYSFCSQTDCSDGQFPGALVQATDGNLYGTTQNGGANNFGTVFKITTNGTLTTLYSFCSQSGCADGEYPANVLVQSAKGNLFGIATAGGGLNAENIYVGAGTIFEITPEGALTTLYHFCSQSGCLDGNAPSALLQAADGNLYGTTIGGGVNYQGIVFELTPSGTFTTLHSFCSQADCTDGQSPAALAQATNGVFYGTTLDGGNRGSNGYCDSLWPTCGTVFSLSLGLGSFVETRPSVGVVGETVAIVGYGLTGATSVTFNGTPASIVYDAATVIYAKVPAGATTGKVQIVTSSGTLTSNVAFEVAP